MDSVTLKPGITYKFKISNIRYLTYCDINDKKYILHLYDIDGNRLINDQMNDVYITGKINNISINNGEINKINVGGAYTVTMNDPAILEIYLNEYAYDV